MKTLGVEMALYVRRAQKPRKMPCWWRYHGFANDTKALLPG